MQKPSDEQYREIYNAMFDAMCDVTKKFDVEFGRAAFEASCRIALASPSWDEVPDAEPVGVGEYYRLPEGALRRFLANRLRLLTEPEVDEAVRAAMDVAKRGAGTQRTWESLIPQIVAAVREADKKGK